MFLYKDLRTYLESLKSENELVEIKGADWNAEMGALCELIAERTGPAILFDEIKTTRHQAESVPQLNKCLP